MKTIFDPKIGMYVEKKQLGSNAAQIKKFFWAYWTEFPARATKGWEKGQSVSWSIKARIAIGKGREPEGAVLSKMKCGNGEKERSVRIWLQ